jgi:DnaJ homolog subfamily C member 17
MALDAKMRLKEARKARYAQYDMKRKNLVDELEERERSFKKAKVKKEEKEKEMWRENERIMEEGRLMREKRDKELREKVEEAERKARTPDADGPDPPSLGIVIPFFNLLD